MERCGSVAISDRGQARLPKSMRALVTGSTGFLGSHLVRGLLGHGDAVAVLLRPVSDPWRLMELLDRVVIIKAETPADPAIADALAAFGADVIFDLAWAGVHGRARRAATQFANNFGRVAAVLSLALAAHVPTVVGVGSQAEVGPQDGIVDDETIPQPETAYGVSKLAAGLLLTEAGPALGIRAIWLRLLSAYGPMDDPGYVIPYVVRELLAGRSPRLTSGIQHHDTLFCQDVAEALRLAAATEGCHGMFTLASGEEMSVRQIAETARALMGPGAPEISYGTASGHPGWRGSSLRFRESTRWSPATPLTAGLSETIEWYRLHADS